MIQKNPFLKRLIRDQKSDIFHSSAYAKIQSGSSLGAASSESFATRRKIDQNRQNIGRYNNSHIVGQSFSNAPHPQEYTPPERSFGPNSSANTPGVPAKPASNPRSSVPNFRRPS